MKKVTVTIGDFCNLDETEGIKTYKKSLKDVRKQLENKGFIELNVQYKAGKHILTYITEKVDRLILIDSGLIKGTKAERKQLARVKDNPKEKYNLLGYSYVPTLKDKVADMVQ